MHWVNSDGVEEVVTAPLDGTILEGVYGNFDSILDQFPRSFKLYTTPHAPRDVICLVPMLTVC